MYSTMGRYRIAICSCCALWLLAAVGCWAQGRPMISGGDSGPAGSDSAGGHRKVGQEAKAAYPANAPADPASVSLKDGKLTISANNSDLTQILQELAHISGITVKGIDKGPRVFGQYGPGDSREVLSTLLRGSGYDFVMLGGAGDGTPRELVLTRHDEKAAETPPGKVGADAPSSQGNPSGEHEPLGPGAVYPIPPQVGSPGTELEFAL